MGTWHDFGGFQLVWHPVHDPAGMLMFKNGVFMPLVYAKDDDGVWRIQERMEEEEDEEEEEREDAWPSLPCDAIE